MRTDNVDRAPSLPKTPLGDYREYLQTLTYNQVKLELCCTYGEYRKAARERLEEYETFRLTLSPARPVSPYAANRKRKR